MAMSSNTTGATVGQGNGSEQKIHSPRARKPVNTAVERTYNEEAKHGALTFPNRTSSGLSTPAPPEDAPPSVKATSAARRELRRKQRMFPTVEYMSRLSYFDPNSDYSNFRGFFVLFWIGLAIMAGTAMLRSLKDTGYLVSFRQWPLFTENIWELAASDVLMVGSTGLALPMHKVFKNSKGILRWSRGGMILQSLFQAGWLAFWVSWPFMRDWTWTAQVFLTLHILVLFMKMHSYAFYNGHLSKTLNRLKELDEPIRPTTPMDSAIRYRTSLPDYATHPSNDLETSVHIQHTEEEHDLLPPVLQLREDLAIELTSPMGNVTYPSNLTWSNFADYLLCPTLCYELEYPRMEKRSYLELFYKTLATFGCIFLMTVTSEEFIIPVLDSSHVELQNSATMVDKALVFAETVSSLLFPFMITFLLVFLVIFEYVLGAFAEITRFGDRKFYSDWWNSLDWLEFSREWNIPVHNFFRRHIYSASRTAQISRPVATAITFFISAIAHELVMGCITRKFRGYGFVLMMLQIPFVAIQRMKWVRQRTLLNNVIFWICMIMGLSLLCALYVLV
ncbi:sterol O-acyltransferase [Hortaea werneckii]|nr:sterol O-acyltransferase [Hortaea werneckii]